MLQIKWVRVRNASADRGKDALEMPPPIRRRVDNLKRVRRRLRDELATLPEQDRQAHLERIGDISAEIDALYALLKAARP